MGEDAMAQQDVEGDEGRQAFRHQGHPERGRCEKVRRGWLRWCRCQ